MGLVPRDGGTQPLSFSAILPDSPAATRGASWWGELRPCSFRCSCPDLPMVLPGSHAPRLVKLAPAHLVTSSGKPVPTTRGRPTASLGSWFPHLAETTMHCNS